MKKYLVTIARFGFVEVEANSEGEAMYIADNMQTEDISWSDDWEATDVKEDDEE
jgi:hypothetical protein